MFIYSSASDVNVYIALSRFSFHMSRGFWGSSVAPGARVQINLQSDSILIITNICIVDSALLPGGAPTRLFYHPSDRSPILLATFIPGEISHSVLSFEVPGGILENRGNRPIHIAGYVVPLDDSGESGYEEDDG
jgi:hypothetical protein